KDFSENIVESISVGVLVLGLDERVESWNNQMEALIGITRADALGRKLGELFPETLIDAIKTRTGRSAFSRSQAVTIYKHPLKTPARSLIVDITVSPLFGKQGEVTGQLIIIDDKTERIKLEDQLVQSEKLTSIGLLAAGIAHEVNTPLAVISSYSQMLHKQLHHEDPKAKSLDKTINQSFRASEIANS